MTTPPDPPERPELPDPGEATLLLQKAAAGAEGQGEVLVGLLQRELRALAGRAMAGERGDHTLQASALVNEAWLKLFAPASASFEDRRHFLRVAARAMRQILIDHARAKRGAQRGGERERAAYDIALDGRAADEFTSGGRELDLIALDEALDALEARDERQAQIVQLRYFGGLSVEDVATALDISESTVAREWRFARAWLLRQLDGPTETHES